MLLYNVFYICLVSSWKRYKTLIYEAKYKNKVKEYLIWLKHFYHILV